MSDTPLPIPSADWIYQRDLAQILGFSEHTASVWAVDGRLRRFEHGVPNCGRRKYSLALVQRELSRHWEAAINYQDAAQGKADEVCSDL